MTRAASRATQGISIKKRRHAFASAPGLAVPWKGPGWAQGREFLAQQPGCLGFGAEFRATLKSYVPLKLKSRFVETSQDEQSLIMIDLSTCVNPP